MKQADEVCRRVQQLRRLNSHRDRANRTIRAVMNGGEEALEALLGPGGDVSAYSIPAANLVLSGLQRLGQKIGRMPDMRVDPPLHKDTQRARRMADKRARIVDSYDDAAGVEQLVQQAGLWLPGYGYVTFVIKPAYTTDGFPFPLAELRDPFETYIGEFGVARQPADVAYCWKMPARQLLDAYPRRDDLRQSLLGRGSGGAVILGQGSWTSNSGSGVEVAEYYDSDGCWLVVPERRIVLEHYDNPLRSGPAFVAVRRVAFDKLISHYEHGLGLQSAMTKMNTLAVIAMEDAVNTETNIAGDVVSDTYRKGADAINLLTPGTRVERPVAQLPYQLFQEIARIEDQFRKTVGYSPMDDAQSPANAAATGQGLDRLMAGLDLEVRQYHKSFEHGLQLLDRKRLEYDERSWPDRRKPLVGVHRGEPFAEEYTPAKDINGSYRTRRTFGAMAGLDDAQRIVALLQLLQADLIDPQTAREQLVGLENLSRIEHRVRANKVETYLMNAVVSGQPVDPRVAMTLIEMLPESDMKQTFRKFWTADEPQMSEQEAAMAGVAPPDAGALGPPEDVATVLARLTAGGQVAGGVQTVGRL